MGESKKPTDKAKSLKKANNNEREARKQILEELFYDFNKSESQVYKVNFIRGIFFGFGTILGGTVLIAIIIAVLGQFAHWLPTISVPVNIITNSLQK